MGEPDSFQDKFFESNETIAHGSGKKGRSATVVCPCEPGW